MVERRMEIRKKLMAFTMVRDKQHGMLLGYLGDLSAHGLLVIGEKLLELGTQVTLEVQFPDPLPETSTRQMVIAARVARCVPDPNSPREFNIGFEFVDLEPAHSQIIQSVLERYHFRHQD